MAPDCPAVLSKTFQPAPHSNNKAGEEIENPRVVLGGFGFSWRDE
jgi:hypothetical protein